MTSLLLVVALLCTMTPTVFAQDLEEFREAYKIFTEEEQRRIEEIIQSSDSADWLGVYRENLPLDSDVSSYPLCLECSWFSVSVCAADATLIYEGYHKGFLDLFETDCYAYYFVSRGAEMCPTCYIVLWDYEQHNCREYHKKCSKGDYDVCPMQVS